MHIIQLIPELNQGGVERGVVELNRELVKKGHKSTVISAGGKLSDVIMKDGGTHIEIDVCSKNPLTFLTRVSLLKAAFKKLNPDILHARSRVPAWLCWFANKSLKIPFITTVHGFNSVSKYSEIMTKGDVVICVSNPVKNYIQEHYKTDDSKIRVIHRCVDPDEFNPENIDQKWIENFKSEYKLENKYVISSVGRITELKDYETFINAISICSKEIPEIVGVIVGGIRHDKKEYFERLENLTKEIGIENQIVFAGSQSKMAEIYELSDLLISSSKKPESFGRTIVEAMAMNTPVIATRHGGALDIIQEGRNGELFTPGNPQELASKILKQKSEPKSDLRSYTLKNFSLEKMVDSTIEVYDELHSKFKTNSK